MGCSSARSRDREYDRDRLRDLVHHAIWASGGRGDLDTAKLFRIAWFAEARQWLLTGKSITGAAYVRTEPGPTPIGGRAVLQELVCRRDVETDGDKGLRSRKKPVTRLTCEELAQIDYWIEQIDKARTPGQRLRDYGWQIADVGEPLPFSASLANRVRKPDNDELEWARERVGVIGVG